MPVKTLLRPLALFFFLIISLGTAQATVTLPNLFGSNMVLQRGMPVRVWGAAAVGEAVTLVFNGQTLPTVADSTGAWSVTLSSMTYTTTGQTLTVTGSGNQAAVTNVLVGDVFFCSGQSNMEFTLGACTGSDGITLIGSSEAATVNLPNIRLIHPDKSMQLTPANDIVYGTNWFTCTSSNSSSLLNFSGLAYFTARNLYQSEGIPIGLIEEAYGGMPAEVFMSPDILQSEPTLAPSVVWFQNPSAYSAYWPTGCYNAMIAPWTKFAIKAVMWDQGESNDDSTKSPLDPSDYKVILEALVKDWRMKWGYDFVFLNVQLQNINQANSGQNPSLCNPKVGWADVRWGQLNNLKLPLSGMSVNFDIHPNITSTDTTTLFHPPNKADFAKRFSPWAERLVYDHTTAPLSFTGPLYRSYDVVGSNIAVHFDFPNGTGFGSSTTLTGFQIASAGTTNFMWATPTVSGNDILVGNPAVTSPGRVRYAWAYNPLDPAGPVANLRDADGYLASPFQTFDYSNMFVVGKGVTIPDMNLTPSTTDGTDFGITGLSQSVTMTYTIANILTNNQGQGVPLTLTGGTTLVRVVGASASDFIVVSQPSSVVALGSTTTFQVAFLPGAEGLRQAILQIPCNTYDKTPYTVYLQGTGINNYTQTPTPVGTWFTTTPTATQTGTPTLTPTVTPLMAVTLIDDFEDVSRGPAVSRTDLWGGNWLLGNGSSSTVNVAYSTPGAGGTTRSVSLYGTIGAGPDWSNFAAGLGSSSPYNALTVGTTGIHFWIYGDGHTYRAQVMLNSITDSDHYGVSIIPAANQWTHYEIPFTSMTRAGWGTQSPAPPLRPTPVDVTGIKFDTQQAGSFYYGLDQVDFYALATPTLSPTPVGTWYTSTPTKTPQPDNTTYNFEDGTSMGWAASGSLSGAITAAVNSGVTYYLGSDSLQLSLNGSGIGEIQVFTNFPYTDLSAKTINEHLYVPSTFPTGVVANVMVKSGSGWAYQIGPNVTLVPGQWNTLSFSAPTAVTESGTPDLTQVMSVGLHIGTVLWTGSIYLDSVDLYPHVVNTSTPTGTPTPSPTVTFTPTGTWNTATPTSTVPPDTATYPFETGIMSWTTVYHAVTGSSKVATPVYLGAGALAVTFDTSNTEGEIGVQPPSITNIVGGMITAHVWVPAGIPAGSFADVFIKSGSGWCWQNGVTVALNPGAWTTLTFDASNPFSTQGTGPDLTAVQAIGVQLQVASTWSGVFYVDSVNIAVGGTTPTATLTTTPSTTIVNTSTVTLTPTAADTSTLTSTATPTFSSTSTATSTATLTATSTWTSSATSTFTVTASFTDTPTVTLTPTITDTPTITPTPMGGLDVPFPNPNDGVLPVRFCHAVGQTINALNLKIYTVSGRKIYDQPCLDESGDSLSAGQHCYKLDWQDTNLKLSNGLYYFVLIEKGGLNTKQTMKVFIER